MIMSSKLKRVFFEKEALDYELGKKIYNNLKQNGYDINFLQSHNRVTGIPGKDAREAFFQGKNTLVVGVRRTLDFATCKPSAHYQLPLVTGCEGICEYCYLNTQLGKKPYTRIYVNIDEILIKAKEYIKNRSPELTYFEAGATSDPVTVEPFSGSLAKAITFFGKEDLGRLRFATKFPYVDGFIGLEHNKHTRIRFSVNSDRIIKTYEHRTPDLTSRLNALGKIIADGYLGGVIIAPVFLEGDWKKEYLELLNAIKNHIELYNHSDFKFEIISHRFTTKAKNNILQVFPQSSLPMDEKTDRKYKYGQFGYGKYVYTNEKLEEMKNFFSENINKLFPDAKIDYII